MVFVVVIFRTNKQKQAYLIGTCNDKLDGQSVVITFLVHLTAKDGPSGQRHALHYQGLVATTPPDPEPEEYSSGQFYRTHGLFI